MLLNAKIRTFAAFLFENQIVTMSKKRVLFVTQEMKPYTALGQISELVRTLPQAAQSDGMEIRILMPRYGTINERRHRLHEVVRLSGMNIIVDDEDFPLIIKVASLPGARMQVYFLDNEEFFKRKQIFTDDKEKPFKDNSDRMIFFCKGVIETVKKFGWPPDVIHLNGWMTSLIPLYLKTVYKNEPLFKNSNVLYSVYGNEMEKHMTNNFHTKARINNLTEEDIANYVDGDNVLLDQGGIEHADSLVHGLTDLDDSLMELIRKADKPTFEHMKDATEAADYINFYHSLMGDDGDEKE